GDFGDVHRGNGLDHFGAVADDPALLRFLAHHESRYVLKEEQWNSALAAKLDEVGAFQRRIRKQDPLIPDYAHRMAHPRGEAANQGLAVIGLEFLESAPVHQPGDDLL